MLSGLSGADAHVPRLSFSAALTVPMERAGTIVFDKIFVNEGDFYDARTGEHGGVGGRGPGVRSPAPLVHMLNWSDRQQLFVLR